MHNDDGCIGCRACQEACPYSVVDVEKAGAPYSVISFNGTGQDAYRQYEDESELITGVTASGAELARKVGQVPPYRNRFTHSDYGDTRRAGITEKCTFCAHRVDAGEIPWCVAACPAGARFFGDLNDPDSEVGNLLQRHEAKTLKEECGTEPNVYYIRSFQMENKS